MRHTIPPTALGGLGEYVDLEELASGPQQLIVGPIGDSRPESFLSLRVSLLLMGQQTSASTAQSVAHEAVSKIADVSEEFGYVDLASEEDIDLPAMFDAAHNAIRELADSGVRSDGTGITLTYAQLEVAERAIEIYEDSAEGDGFADELDDLMRMLAAYRQALTDDSGANIH
jgi:hypothetical protein